MSIPEKPEIAKCHVALCSRTPLPFKKGRLKTSKAGFSDGLYFLAGCGTLTIIFRSDVTSKHASKRAAVQRQVDRLVDEMDRIRAVDSRSAMRPALDGNKVMEILGIGPGPELGKVMRFLNSDEGILLNEDEAINMIVEKFGSGKNVSHV